MVPVCDVLRPETGSTGRLERFQRDYLQAGRDDAETPKEFDFQGIPWSAQFHYTGPFHDIKGREPTAFPCEELTGNPLVYASMGTLVNGLERVYKIVLKAVGQLSDIQVVLSVDANVNLDDLGTTSSNVIVVRTAPQLELLKRAALCITHAGLNTAVSRWQKESL